MRVAFDVQGTLIGRHSAKVIKLFKWLQQQGHEMHVWSFGGYWMAKDAIDRLGLGENVLADAKFSSVHDGEPHFDLAVDDEADSVRTLSAKRFILVEDIPENESDFAALIGQTVDCPDQD